METKHGSGKDTSRVSPAFRIEKAIRKFDSIDTKRLLFGTEKDTWKNAMSEIYNARREMAERAPNFKLVRRQLADALDDLLPFRDTSFSGVTIRDEYLDLCEVRKEL